MEAWRITRARKAADAFSGHFANSQWWSRDLLFGVKGVDPRLDSAIVGVLGVVGIAGCGLPTWRALIVDPAFALREE